MWLLDWTLMLLIINTASLICYILRFSVYGRYSHWSLFLYSTFRFINFLILCARYNVIPPTIQNKCDGLFQTFSVRYALSCSNRGLVIARHNEIRDNTIHLVRQVFYPAWIRGKPLLHQGCSRPEGWWYHDGCITLTQIDVIIRSIWYI